MSVLLPAVLLVLVAANAFFVVGEYAVVTARRGPLTTRAEHGDARARVALGLMDDPVRVISTVQVGITAVGILSGAVAGPAVSAVLGDGVPAWLTFVVAFGLVTYLSVVLGELVPKAVTLDRAEWVLVIVARPIALMGRALRPAVWLLERSGELILRPLGIRSVVAGEGVRTPQELREVVDEAEGSGVIELEQEQLLHRVFDFAEQEAGDIMVPAAKVTWLDADLPVQGAMAAALQSNHSRFPIARGTLDYVLGVVHLRDLASTPPATPVGKIATPPHLIPPTKKLEALLHEMREARLSVAMVADEYGRTLGLVSLEDIVEQIVGDIHDEHDLPDDRVTRTNRGDWLVAGSISLDDLAEQTGVHLASERSRTVAGLIFDTLGRRPVPGDVVEIDGMTVIVDDVEGHQISKVRIHASSS